MNLYQIEQDLLELESILEEQGGEFTEEQLQQLECTKEDFKNKIEGYYKYVKNIQGDIVQCKEEENRIKLLRKSRESAVKRLQTIMLDAVKQFGNVNKSGVLSIEYPTFKLSTRRSDSIVMNEKRCDDFIRLIRNYLDELDVMCCINNLEDIEIEGMLGAINAIYQSEFDDITEFIPFTIDDFNNMEISVESKFPLHLLFTDKSYNSLAKAIIDNPNTFVLNNTSKDSIKTAIDHGSIITIADKVTNLSLQMK